jgi:F-type H+-transporting ATPase subunit epsilon
MAISVHLDIVSSEAQIFSGLVEMLVVTGSMGELGILPGHAPLLTNIKPGHIKVVRQGGTEELFYVSGGILEVQPDVITILADTVIRAADLDEAAALQSKEAAEQLLAEKKGQVDFSTVLIQLARAAAQLRTVSLYKGKRK